MDYTEPDHPTDAADIKHADLYASCDHHFTVLKSDTDLLGWYCYKCHDGPSWYIFECSICELKVCRQCAEKT